MDNQEICASTLEEIEDRAGLSRGSLQRFIDDVVTELLAKESWSGLECVSGPLFGMGTAKCQDGNPSGVVH